jgi:hypothetical protein
VYPTPFKIPGGFLSLARVDFRQGRPTFGAPAYPWLLGVGEQFWEVILFFKVLLEGISSFDITDDFYDLFLRLGG